MIYQKVRPWGNSMEGKNIGQFTARTDYKTRRPMICMQVLKRIKTRNCHQNMLPVGYMVMGQDEWHLSCKFIVTLFKCLQILNTYVFRFYLWQVGYVFGSVGLTVCLFVCLLAILLESLWMDFDEIFRKDWGWYNKPKFWQRSRSCLKDNSGSNDPEGRIVQQPRKICHYKVTNNDTDIPKGRQFNSISDPVALAEVCALRVLLVWNLGMATL